MTREYGNKEFWLSHLRSEGAAMRAALEAADAGESGLAAEVPSCPGWTMQDLAQHVAGVYLRHRSHLGRGVTTKPESDPRDSLGELPTGTAAIRWYADEQAALVSLLDTVDPQLPAWNWAPAPKQANFWFRRMAHETAVHRWDAQAAVGAVEPIDAKLAGDGVTEVLDTWLPAGRRKGPTDRTGVVWLVAADLEQEWFVRLRDEGIALLDTDSWLEYDEPHARVQARGTASDVELALYGRVSFEVLEIAGDPTLLESLRTG